MTDTAARIAAAIISEARHFSGKTAPEFDYDISCHYNISVDGIGGEFSPLGNANYRIARDFGNDPAEQWIIVRAELMAYARRCHERQYTGWSAAAQSRGGRIKYAQEGS